MVGSRTVRSCRPRDGYLDRPGAVIILRRRGRAVTVSLAVYSRQSCEDERFTRLRYH